MTVKADPKRPYKAYAAAGIAFLGLLWANLQGVKDWSTLNAHDWLTIIIPTVLTFGGTYFVSNPPATAVRRNQRGAGEVDLLVRVVVLIIVVAFVIWLVRVLIHG